MELVWKTDDDGDLHLDADDGHVGVLCPHHPGFFRVSCHGGSLCRDFDTIEEAKAFMEAEARGESPTGGKPYELDAWQKAFMEITDAFVELATERSGK